MIVEKISIEKNMCEMQHDSKILQYYLYLHSDSYYNFHNSNYRPLCMYNFRGPNIIWTGTKLPNFYHRVMRLNYRLDSFDSVLL